MPRPLSKQASPSVRGVSVQRANRLRLSWFILGAGAGIVGSLLFSTLADLAANSIFSAEQRAEQSAAHDAPAATEKPKGIAAIAKPEWPRDVKIKVSNGDNLLGLLLDQGIEREDAYAIISSMKSSFDPKDLRVGLTLDMTLNKEHAAAEAETPYISKMNIAVSNIENVSLNRMDDGSYQTLSLKKPTVLKVDWGKQKIHGSLYYTAKKKGLPDSAILELIRAYSYDVDFQRDIKEGDTFEVLYEKKVTEDGQLVSTGNVLFADLVTGGKSLKMYRFVDAFGVAHFYNDKGESIVKQLLRTPMDGARISSGFGMRRHPVLGYSRMHKGIDFAAPTGTPIYAAGDGTVSFAGRRGDYGNYVMIKHNPTYSTAYGHASRIAPGIRPGARVKQGQVVAYVGATGMATGPHLHYEILLQGAQVNPANVKFAGGDKLGGKDLARFAQIKQNYQRKIADLKGGTTPTQVAAR